MKIEMVYALPNEQSLWSLEVVESCTVEAAIEQSGIKRKYPDIDLERNKVGIFSKPVTLSTVLREGDRVEIYRPLIADPKEVRRKKALAQESNPKN